MFHDSRNNRRICLTYSFFSVDANDCTVHIFWDATLFNKLIRRVLRTPNRIFIISFVSVLERPSSQMSYLDQFLKETNSNQQQPPQQHTSQQFDQQSAASGQPILYHAGSIESEEGDIEDNRALSITSSKSNLSELSLVSFRYYL